MFAYCNNNPIRFIDDIGGAPKDGGLAYYADGKISGFGGGGISVSPQVIGKGILAGIIEAIFGGDLGDVGGSIIYGVFSDTTNLPKVVITALKGIYIFFDYLEDEDASITSASFDRSFYKMLSTLALGEVSIVSSELNNASYGLFTFGYDLTVGSIDSIIHSSIDQSISDNMMVPSVPYIPPSVPYTRSSVGGGARNTYNAFS